MPRSRNRPSPAGGFSRCGTDLAEAETCGRRELVLKVPIREFFSGRNGCTNRLSEKGLSFQGSALLC